MKNSKKIWSDFTGNGSHTDYISKTKSNCRYLLGILFLFFFFLDFAVSLHAQNFSFTYNNEYIYLKHIYSDKYLCSGDKENQGQFWMWGPIPAGHEERYTFLKEFAGDGKFYLKHIYSGKYLCSGDKINQGKFWMWGPIPAGHEDRYAFRFEPVGGDKYNLKHVYSGKYLCSGDKVNQGQFWMWGPIPAGHEDRYTFEVTRNMQMAQAPVIDKIEGSSYSSEFGTLVVMGEKVILHGNGFSAVNNENKIGIRNRNSQIVPPQSVDYLGELNTTLSTTNRLEAVIPENLKSGLVYLWIYVEGKGHSNPVPLYIAQKPQPPIFSTSGDLEALDWCYSIGSSQGKMTITFRAIIKNVSKTLDWASKQEGYYTIGATVGSVGFEEKHTLLPTPYWSLAKDNTAMLDGVTVPFHEDNKYLFIGNWVLFHPEDTNANNNTNNGQGYTVYPGTAFEKGGLLYQMGKQCYSN